MPQPETKHKAKAGDTYGRLTLISPDDNKYHKHRWLCRCKCGNYKTIFLSCLISKKTKSCGCLRKELLSARRKKHGLTNTKFYNTWYGIINRCNNGTHKSYKYYGGRGIEVCQKWSSFQNFKNDMYSSYIKHSEIYGEKNTSLDRINNNGNYEPSNCRWVTLSEQANNTKRGIINNIIQDVDGTYINLYNFSKKYNIKYHTLLNWRKNNATTLDMIFWSKIGRRPLLTHLGMIDFYNENKHKINNEKKSKILNLRFEKMLTLQQISDIHKLSVERIRQILNDCFNEMV